jgi:4-oxalocrotonate tautomerase
MPFVNIKYVRQQVSHEQKTALVNGVMDIVVVVLKRNPELTVITVDELDRANWYIGKSSIEQAQHDKVCAITINISKGTSTAEQMAEAIRAGKELVKRVLGSNDLTNYFIINELNPDAWGFDGISMTIRNQMEK